MNGRWEGRPLGRKLGIFRNLQAIQYVWNIYRAGESGELAALR